MQLFRPKMLGMLLAKLLLSVDRPLAGQPNDENMGLPVVSAQVAQECEFIRSPYALRLAAGQ